MSASSFLDSTKLNQVQTRYTNKFDKVDELESNLTTLSETIDNLDDDYLSLSGGTVTGAVLSSYNGEIANNAFVTKSQVAAMIPSVSGYMPATGGQFTGDVTTTNTTFTDTSLVTKDYVDGAIDDIDLSDYVPNDGNTTTGSFKILRTYTNTLDEVSLGLTDSDGAAYIQVKKPSGQYAVAFGLSGPNGAPAITIKDGKAHFTSNSEALSVNNEIAVKSDINNLNKAIFDVQTLPTGASIRDVLYRTSTPTPAQATLNIVENPTQDDIDAFGAFFISIGFTAGTVPLGSGGSSGNGYIAPANSTYTITLGGDSYTISSVYYDNNSFYVNYSPTGNADLYAGEYTISYANNVYHYYLGNSNNQTTTELVIPDMNNYATNAQYNELLNAYNDLADRLNQFLINTGDADFPLSTTDTMFKTVPNTSSITISYRQGIANNFTVDWGDGSEPEESNNSVWTNSTLTHNYSEAGQYIITVTNNDPEANDSFVNLSGTAANQFVYANIVEMDYTYQNSNSTITKLYYNANNINYSGSGPYYIEWTGLEEAYLKSVEGGMTISFDTSSLRKATIDASKIDGIGYPLFDTSCTNLEEIHFTSTTVPTDGYGSKYEYLFGKSDDEPYDYVIPANVTIYVPAEAVNAYKTAWPEFASIIEAES